MFNSPQQIEEIKEHLQQINHMFHKINGYVNLDIFSFEQLNKHQLGYSVDLEGNSLITDEEGSWKRSWVVIAHDTLSGDPIIVDLNEEGYPVSILMHGLGSWGAGSFLSNSMSSFANSLIEVTNFLDKKDKKIIGKKDLEAMLNKIVVDSNGYADYDTWESLLNPLFEFIEDNENTRKHKVRNMKKEGKKIREISSYLDISSKDVYDYLKQE